MNDWEYQGSNSSIGMQVADGVWVSLMLYMALIMTVGFTCTTILLVFGTFGLYGMPAIEDDMTLAFIASVGGAAFGWLGLIKLFTEHVRDLKTRMI